MNGKRFAPVDVNPHLVRDLQTRLGTSDLTEWIEAQAEKLARASSSDDHIEFTQEMYCSRRIREVCPADVVGAASIRPASGDQYDIFYNPFYKETSPRWRFAIAHELGHTYWFAPGGGAKPLSPMQWKLGRDPGIEYLCDRFASALLMPRQRLTSLIDRLADKLDIPLHLVFVASCVYQAPDRAAARRIFFETAQKNIAIVCLKRSSLKKERQWKTDWCILPSSSQALSGKGFRIPLLQRGRSIPTDMIPKVPFGGTHPWQLDGRWWDLLQMKPDPESRIWFSRLSPGSTKVGYVSNAGQKLYFALPIACTEA